jgi:hypothetical protein
METLLALSGVILTPIIVGVHSKLVFGKILWKWATGLFIVAVIFRVDIYYNYGQRISSDPVTGPAEAATPLIIALIIYTIVAIKRKRKLRKENSENN